MARWPFIVPFRRTHTPSAPALFEPLEGRVLMYDAPFLSNLPSVDELENANNTVVRFQTNWGFFDIELFDTVAPTTVQNFINYVKSGAYDEMFFHRATTIPTTGIAVLQGGGFKFRDGTGKTDIETNAPIQNEFQRLNIAGTIAMAKLGGQPNSATSQFFFNLVDNPALDNPLNSGGFTVFGRVVQGWSVVTSAGTATLRDLDLPLTGSNPNPGLFDTVPTHASYNTQVGPRESSLVYVWDAEIIKSRNVQAFYDEAVYFPEGWRGPTIAERLDLVNSSTASINHYQIIVRYENGERDQVITSGTIVPRGRRSIKISDAVSGLVRPGVGYAIEVRSTFPLAASLNHRDFGVTLAETFQRVEDFNAGWLTKWNFAHGEKGPGMRSFLVWQNLTDKDAIVVVTINFNTGSPHTFVYSLPRYGRGGVNIGGSHVLPSGRYSVEVTSSHAIIAALSIYETSGTGPEQITDGSLAAGVPSGGRTEGYLAAAKLPTGGSSLLSFHYSQPSPAAVIVDVFFYLTNGTVLTAANPVLLSSTTRRVDRNLAAFGVQLPVDQYFSIGYKVRNNAGNVSVHYLSQEGGDTLSTPFAIVATGTSFFADGFADPIGAGNGYFEIISIFSPYTNASVEFGYRVRYRFGDGTEVAGPTGMLEAHGRIDIVPQQSSALMAKVLSGNEFRNFSIVIDTGQSVGSTPLFGAGVTQITRVHPQANWRQAMTSLPTLDESFPLVWMSAPQFD